MVDNNKLTLQSAASFDPYDQKRRKKQIAVEHDGIPIGHKFDLLAFDIGQVSVPFHWPSVEQGFADRAQRPVADVTMAMGKLSKLGYEEGKISTEGFLAELNRLLESDISLGEFPALWNTSFRECEKMVPILETLGDKYRLFALSNTNEVHFQFLGRVLEVYRHYEELILSHQVGYMKPDKRIYQEVIKRTGRKVRKDRILFVDDKPAFVEGARKYGIHAIVFTTPEAFAKRITEIGLLD